VVNNIDYDEIVALTQQPNRFAALSDLSAALIFATAAWYKERYNWVVSGVSPTDAEWHTIQRAIGNMEYELMQPLVGLIFPHALASLSGLPFLPCDGEEYAQEDYPLLYAALDAVYKPNAGFFHVPDLLEKFPLGAGNSPYALDDFGGEYTHTLTVDEMPAHTHTNTPHTHTEGIAVPFPTLVGAGAPAVYAQAGAGVTGASGVVIDSTGGGQAFDKFPPYRAVHFCIVAG